MKELKDVKDLFNLRAIRAGIQWEVEERAGSSRHLGENAVVLGPQGTHRPLERLVRMQNTAGCSYCVLERELELSSL